MMMQFTCVKCGEIFCVPEDDVTSPPNGAPIYLDPEDGEHIAHAQHEDGTPCGSIDIRFDGCWGSA